MWKHSSIRAFIHSFSSPSRVKLQGQQPEQGIPDLLQLIWGVPRPAERYHPSTVSWNCIPGERAWNTSLGRQQLNHVPRPPHLGPLNNSVEQLYTELLTFPLWKEPATLQRVPDSRLCSRGSNVDRPVNWELQTRALFTAGTSPVHHFIELVNKDPDLPELLYLRQ